MDRKDISVLVIDKKIHPIEHASAENKVYPAALRLIGLGFSVDLVYSLAEHVFDNFEVFFRQSLAQYRQSGGESESIEDIYKYLRKTPIKSVADLAQYRAVICHPALADFDIINDLITKYPGIPIVMPSGCAAQSSQDPRKIHVVYKDWVTSKVIDLLKPLWQPK